MDCLGSIFRGGEGARRLAGWASSLSQKHSRGDQLIDSSVPPDPRSWRILPWSVAPVASGLWDTLQQGVEPCGRPGTPPGNSGFLTHVELTGPCRWSGPVYTL